ncbi:MAG: nuclear transport factor 2 family protein [Verrucomicrobiaceae bacterium]|nr:MAG: nuclear transport factor 2 family protein [Verrucomicrobiaceae bacterium]
MNNSSIEMMEDRLRQAVLSSNVYALEEMLADDLVFIDQSGRRLGKAEDIEVYRRGLVSVAKFDVLEQTIRSVGEVNVVHSLVEISGRALGTAFDGQFYYTRVWTIQDGRWRVISAQATAAQR